MRWLVADSLYCPEAFFCSHLDSYSHYLREYGESVESIDVTSRETALTTIAALTDPGTTEVLLALDKYEVMGDCPFAKRIAQVAAICNPMPWDVRKPDGSPAYDLIVSSIPWMVDAARAKGCRAEYQPLAFDTRARACGMGVKRDLGCIFIGTTGTNHVRRTQLLEELKDVVQVLPPVFGRAYFGTLARAKVVLNVHAEWSRGVTNNMRMFEAAGLGSAPVSDGEDPPGFGDGFGWVFDGTARDARAAIGEAMAQPDDDHGAVVLRQHTYESRIPQLVEWARSL